MAWIKRNLLFTIAGVIALLLLGAAAFYDYQGWSHNSEQFAQLNDIYGKLKQLADQKPGPGNPSDPKSNNTQIAKDQEKEIRAWINQAAGFFKPIAAIPDMSEVTSEAYAAALRRTIDQLQREAEIASVQLPPKYGFSFEAERSTVKFAPGSLAPLAVQLGEVKTIAEILFSARVNSLDAIQRARASDDDAAGSASDYIAETSVTNELAVLTPYAVTFRSFTPELSAVLARFAASPNGFIVKGLNVSPAGQTQSAGFSGGLPGEGFAQPVMPVQQASVAGTSKGGMTVFLNQQLLRITLEVIIVKPLPKK